MDLKDVKPYFAILYECLRIRENCVVLEFITHGIIEIRLYLLHIHVVALISLDQTSVDYCCAAWSTLWTLYSANLTSGNLVVSAAFMLPNCFAT